MVPEQRSKTYTRPFLNISLIQMNGRTSRLTDVLMAVVCGFLIIDCYQGAIGSTVMLPFDPDGEALRLDQRIAVAIIQNNKVLVVGRGDTREKRRSHFQDLLCDVAVTPKADSRNTGQRHSRSTVVVPFVQRFRNEPFPLDGHFLTCDGGESKNRKRKQREISRSFHVALESGRVWKMWTQLVGRSPDDPLFVLKKGSCVVLNCKSQLLYQRRRVSEPTHRRTKRSGMHSLRLHCLTEQSRGPH